MRLASLLTNWQIIKNLIMCLRRHHFYDEFSHKMHHYLVKCYLVMQLLFWTIILK